MVLRQGGGVDLFFNFGLLLVGGCWSYVVSTGDGLGVIGTISDIGHDVMTTPEYYFQRDSGMSLVTN